jgi:hypothetical protein
MSIQVVCPNGHVLKVTDDWAGKKGLCPVCKARVKVPTPSDEQLSEDTILSILGKYDPSKSWKKLSDVSDLAAAETPKALRGKGSAEEDTEGAVDGPSPPKRSCPQCNQEIVAGIRICPHCHTYIARLDDF